MHYTSNMKQIPGEFISLPPGATINGIPLPNQPGQRIYVIQSSVKGGDTFDSIQTQPVVTSVLTKEAKPPPKRKRPPPKPKPPKGIHILFNLISTKKY